MYIWPINPPSDKQSENREMLEEQTYNHTTYENIIVKDGVLFCSRCSRFFPIIDEIPIMLPDRTSRKGKRSVNSYWNGKPRYLARYLIAVPLGILIGKILEISDKS